MRRLWFVPIFALAAYGVWACNFIVDGELDGYSTDCAFAGRNVGACGTCVAQKCNDRVNTCCQQDCRPILLTNTIASCSAQPDLGANPDCRLLLEVDGGYQDAAVANGYSDSVLEHNVDVCIRDNCHDACASTCTIQGFDQPNDCGMCITTKCVAEINVCCTDLVLGDVVSCGTADSCRFLSEDLSADGGCKLSVATCVQQKCGDRCAISDGGGGG